MATGDGEADALEQQGTVRTIWHTHTGCKRRAFPLIPGIPPAMMVPSCQAFDAIGETVSNWNAWTATHG